MLVLRRSFLLCCCALPALRAQQDKPYVLLISLDGFRYDYAAKYHAKNLQDFARRGVAAKALRPSFPSLTFPNHYTIATGLYPAHHGIVDNDFWDSSRQAEFHYNVPAAARDANWWGGTPLWVLAEQQGMRSACYFWPGSEAEIQGKRPSYWFPYDGSVPNEKRAAQAIAWLKLPPAQRPHFVALYFSDVDHEAHLHGPDSPETAAAVKALDAIVGNLLRDVRATGLPVNIFVVSDHGMANVSAEIEPAALAEWSQVKMMIGPTMLHVYSRDTAAIQTLYAKLHGKDARLEIFRRRDIPARLHYADNPRIGDLVVIARRPVLFSKPAWAGYKGMHGYDVSDVPEMRGIFYAGGPNLKSGITIPEFENIHIYPLMAHILGLQVPKNIDGRAEVLRPVLR